MPDSRTLVAKAAASWAGASGCGSRCGPCRGAASAKSTSRSDCSHAWRARSECALWKSALVLAALKASAASISSFCCL
eukprot:4732219-Alexandrium_andersonii.AAC.1